MKNKRIEKIGSVASPVEKTEIQAGAVGSCRLRHRQNLLERWRRLATGLRGVRLFRVTLAVEERVFWEAECALSGEWVCRRFASELHARAWLSVAAQQHISLSSVERQELDRPCSTSCFVTGG